MTNLKTNTTSQLDLLVRPTPCNSLLVSSWRVIITQHFLEPRDITAAMLVYRTVVKKFFREFDSIIM